MSGRAPLIVDGRAVMIEPSPTLPRFIVTSPANVLLGYLSPEEVHSKGASEPLVRAMLDKYDAAQAEMSSAGR